MCIDLISALSNIKCESCRLKCKGHWDKIMILVDVLLFKFHEKGSQLTFFVLFFSFIQIATDSLYQRSLYIPLNMCELVYSMRSQWQSELACKTLQSLSLKYATHDIFKACHYNQTPTQIRDGDDGLLLFHLALKIKREQGFPFVLDAYTGRMAYSKVMTNDNYHD